MGWNDDFRVDGCPEDKRYSSMQEAEAARRRVHQMVPRTGRKGKKQTGGRRPNPITAERVHHSRGKKWEEFIEATGIKNLSEYEQQLLFDSFKNGGKDVFAQWKQAEYKAWKVQENMIVYSYVTKDVINVRHPDGSITQMEVPKMSQLREQNREHNASRKGSGPVTRYCSDCGIALPMSVPSYKTQCKVCAPAETANAFFENLFKKKKDVG